MRISSSDYGIIFYTKAHRTSPEPIKIKASQQWNEKRQRPESPEESPNWKHSWNADATSLLDDLFLYARSFQKAAQALAESLQVEGNPVSEVDYSPVVFMYRHALELHLTALVMGDGGNFLATKPDPLSIHKTHSASWLAHFVAQIVTALKWEPEFRCVGIENLDDFKAVVESVNSVDPGSYAFRLTATKGVFDVRGFAARMDALLALLDATADALAAEWDSRNDVADAMGEAGFMDGPVQ